MHACRHLRFDTFFDSHRGRGNRISVRKRAKQNIERNKNSTTYQYRRGDPPHKAIKRRRCIETTAYTLLITAFTKDILHYYCMYEYHYFIYCACHPPMNVHRVAWWASTLIASFDYFINIPRRKYYRIISSSITGGHSTQDPRCSQKPIYTRVFTHHSRSWLICTPVNRHFFSITTYFTINSRCLYFSSSCSQCRLWWCAGADETTSLPDYKIPAAVATLFCL